MPNKVDFYHSLGAIGMGNYTTGCACGTSPPPNPTCNSFRFILILAHADGCRLPNMPDPSVAVITLFLQVRLQEVSRPARLCCAGGPFEPYPSHRPLLLDCRCWVDRQGYNFLLFSLNSNDAFLNHNYMLAPRLNCHGMFGEQEILAPASTPVGRSHFSRSPPVKLTQPYYKCQYTTYQVRYPPQPGHRCRSHQAGVCHLCDRNVKSWTAMA